MFFEHLDSNCSSFMCFSCNTLLSNCEKLYSVERNSFSYKFVFSKIINISEGKTDNDFLSSARCKVSDEYVFVILYFHECKSRNYLQVYRKKNFNSLFSVKFNLLYSRKIGLYVVYVYLVFHHILFFQVRPVHCKKCAIKLELLYEYATDNSQNGK